MRTVITARAIAPSALGWRSTNADQRAANPVGNSGSGPCSASRRRSRRLRARMPMKDSRAGSRVTEAATVRTTVSEAAIATPPRKLSRRISMPSRAMHTVAPANTTARPVVATALVTASATGSPRLSPRRCLVTMNSA